MPVLRDQAYDVEAVRAQFPVLRRTVYDDVPLVYLDNAATSQKPQVVIDRIRQYYERENSNVHRGVHRLSQDATDAYEEARQRIARFINAPAARQVIFTRGTTEAINLVASSFGRMEVGKGDEVIISTMEHHSNIVPWQILCEEREATLRVIPITDEGELELDAFHELLSNRTVLVAIPHVSNALGTINPVREVIEAAHDAGAVVLLDGAQAAPHMRIDVQELDVDFYCFSSHKMFGPTGMGALYGRESLLEAMPPYHGGGDMIETVTFEKTTYAALPHKFEAGTPHIAGVIGFGEAAAFLEEMDPDAIGVYEQELLAYATEQLSTIDGLRFIGTAENKACVISFLLGDAHPYDTGAILDRLGIAVRTGHHCTEPLMRRLGIPGTVRASFALYNTREDVDRLVEALHKARAMLA